VIPTAEDIRQSTLFVRTIERANQQLSQRLSAQVEAKRAGVQFAQQASMLEETRQVGTTRLPPQEPEWEWSAGGSDEEEAQLEGRLARLRAGREARRRRRRGW
jgi:hypothetical protein